MNPTVADAPLWTALILAGVATGMLGTRWGESRPAGARHLEVLLLLAAGAGVVAWSARAGALLGTGAPPALLTATLPVDVGPGYRLAVLWATLPGAALTLGALLLVAAALTVPIAGRLRFAAATSVLALGSLGVAVWFAPQSQSSTELATIPPFAQSPAAAAAPLFALLALGGLGVIGAWIVASRGRQAVPRQILLGTWLAATAAIAAEQLARSQLGIGPRDGVVLGTASSGLVLWLFIGALMHRRVQGIWTRSGGDTMPGPRARLGTRLAHAGALLLAISFAAHVVARRATLALPPGTAVQVADSFRRPWRLVNQGVSRFDAAGVDVTSLAIEATTPAGITRLMTPELRHYHRRDGEHLATPVGMRRSVRGLAQEVRVLLVETDSIDVASVRVTFLPVPFLWPAGLLLLGTSMVVLASAPGNVSSRPDA